MVCSSGWPNLVLNQSDFQVEPKWLLRQSCLKINRHDLAPSEAAFTPFSLTAPALLVPHFICTLDYGDPCRQFARSTPAPSRDCVDKWVENCGSVLSSFHQGCMDGAKRPTCFQGSYYAQHRSGSRTGHCLTCRVSIRGGSWGTWGGEI